MISASLSMIVSTLGLAVAGLGALTTRDPLAALPITLELWLAAGLLRLSVAATWTNLAVAAVILVVRKLVATQLRTRRRVW